MIARSANSYKSKQKITKIFWLAFTTILVSLSINYVATSVQSYFDYEVITNIETHHTNYSQFPAVSFCVQLNANN